MSTSKAESRAALQIELATVMELITAAQAGDLERASTVATIASLMSKSWTLRYQLASIDHETARDPKRKNSFATMMVRASKEAEAWAKRLGAARKQIPDDEVIDGVEHESKQKDIAGKLKLLASKG